MYQLYLDSYLLQEEDMQTKACRPAVRKQCAPLPRYQLQCQSVCQTVTDSRASSARERLQAPSSLRHSPVHDYFTMEDKAQRGLDQSTHVGQTHPTTLARMPHLVKLLARTCAA